MNNKYITNSKFAWFIVKFIIFISFANAQSSEAYLMPRQIYVGDIAALVVPLPAAQSNINDIVITAGSENMPAHPDIDFHRIALEQRVTGSRLLIEFTPFIPGVLELPVIEIGDESFTELTVTVNSILDEKAQPILAGPASALAMPGTAFLLYGTLTTVIFVLLFTFWFLVRGRTLIKLLIEKWKLSRLFGSIRKTEKNLREGILNGDDKRIIIDRLSDEFRMFLSFLTGCSCRAMTAGEFANLPLAIAKPQDESNPAEKNGEAAPQIDSSFLTVFFRSCDTLRFSGADLDSNDLLRLLDDMMCFVSFQEEHKKKEQKEKQS